MKKLQEKSIEIIGKDINILSFSVLSSRTDCLRLLIETDKKMVQEVEVLLKPELNQQKQEINLKELDINLVKANFIGKSLMVADNFIVKYISNKINPILLQKVIKPLELMIIDQLKKLSEDKGVFINLKQEDIHLDAIKVEKEYLVCMISTNLILEVVV